MDWAEKKYCNLDYAGYHKENIVSFLIFYKQGKEVWRNMGLVEENVLNDKVAEFTK